MNKKTVIALGTLSLVAVMGITCATLANGNLFSPKANDSYLITFSNQENVLTKSESPTSGTSSAKTKRGTDISFNYANVSYSDEHWQVIAQSGYIQNTTHIKGVYSLNMTFSNDNASIKLQYGWNSIETASEERLSAVGYQITYTFPNVKNMYPSLVKISSFDGNQTITSMAIEFSCEESNIMSEQAFSQSYNYEEIAEKEDEVSITEYTGPDTNLTIPSGYFSDKVILVTAIGNFAFFASSNLKSVNIPSSVTSIGGSAFKQCSMMNSVTLSNGLISIGDNAFEDCQSLTSITIPSSVASIGSVAFKNCEDLSDISFKGTKQQWDLVVKGENWHESCPATVVHCTDGDISI